MTIRFSFTGAIPVTRNGMPLFLEKTSFVSLYRTLMFSRIQRKTAKGEIFPRLKSSLKFLRYAQKLQSIIRCFFQSFHLLFGVSREPFHKPAELLLCDGSDFGFCPWPLKLAGFQPFIKQEISIILPDQPFDPVCSPSTKKIKGIGFDRIFSQIGTYGICQTVNPGTQIGISGNDKDLFKTSGII